MPRPCAEFTAHQVCSFLRNPHDKQTNEQTDMVVNITSLAEVMERRMHGSQDPSSRLAPVSSELIGAMFAITVCVLVFCVAGVCTHGGFPCGDGRRFFSDKRLKQTRPDWGDVSRLWKPPHLGGGYSKLRGVLNGV